MPPSLRHLPVNYSTVFMSRILNPTSLKKSNAKIAWFPPSPTTTARRSTTTCVHCTIDCVSSLKSQNKLRSRIGSDERKKDCDVWTLRVVPGLHCSKDNEAAESKLNHVANSIQKGNGDCRRQQRQEAWWQQQYEPSKVRPISIGGVRFVGGKNGCHEQQQ